MTVTEPTKLDVTSKKIWLIPGTIWYLDSFLTSAESDKLFERLLECIDWKQHVVQIFGRRVNCPRLSAWHGDFGSDYSYSGIHLHPEPWSADLTEIRSRVEAVVELTFNSALLNLYRDGRDSIGWHADDEPELGVEPVIASVSLGARRVFRLKKKLKTKRRYEPGSEPKPETFSIDLPPGSLLVMQGKCQAEWKHAVPKTTRKVEPRINLTFRQIVPAWKTRSGKDLLI